MKGVRGRGLNANEPFSKIPSMVPELHKSNGKNRRDIYSNYGDGLMLFDLHGSHCLLLGNFFHTEYYVLAYQRAG